MTLCAAARKRSGSGFARSTSFRVMIGTSGLTSNVDGRLRTLSPSAGCNCIRDASVTQLPQEFARAGKGLNGSLIAFEGCRMFLLKHLRLFSRQAVTDLLPECLNQEAAAHTDAAMNAPQSQ